MKIKLKLKKPTKIIILSILLFFVILLILPNNSPKSLTMSELLMFSIIAVVSIISIVIEYTKYSISLNLMHWIFMLFFFVIPPVVQISFDYKPWGIYQSSQEIIFSCSLILVWIFFYKIGNFFASSLALIPIKNCSKNDISNLNMFIVTLLNLICTAIVVKLVGFSNLFSRATSGLKIEGENSKTISILISNCTKAYITFACSLLLVQVIRKKSNSKKYLFINLIFLLIACFPTGMARNKTAIIYFGLFLTLCYINPKKLKSSVIPIILFLGGFIIIFPAINVFRTVDFKNASFTESIINTLDSFTKNYLSGDYDAFSVIGDVTKYVKEEGITYGYQLLGVLLFFVPRSIWHTKPYGSGQTVFEWLNQPFTNISCPLLSEGYINFGVIGVCLFGFTFGFLASYIDRNFWNRILKNGASVDFIVLIYPYLLTSFFFMIRGDLLSSWAYTFAFVFIFFVSTKILDIK